MIATHLLVVRHGQSEWNAIGRWQGQADPVLSELGRRQAAVAAGLIGAVDGIISSDLRRAFETATIMARCRGVGPVLVDERLRERDAGEWTGLTKRQIDRRWPGWIDGRRRPDGFEDVASVVTRVLAAFSAIHAVSPGLSILVVTHGGVIRSLEKSHGLSGNAVTNLGGITVRVSNSGHVIGQRIAPLDGQMLLITQNEQL